jgi:hypothetical protein
MKKLSCVSTFVLLAFALTPALAKDRDKNERAGDRAQELIDAWQDRIDSGNLSEKQADKAQELIDKIVDRFDIELPPPPPPPPPPPEPTKETIWKDDFNREAGNLGNGWEGQLGKSGVDGEHLNVYSSAGQSSTATNAIDLKGLPAYTDLTVSYTVAFDPTRGDRQFNTYWSADGSDWTKASPIIDDAGVSSFTVQNNGFQGFGIRFETLNFTGVIIDDVTLTGALPADYSPALTQ